MVIVDLNVENSVFRLGEDEHLASFFSTLSYRLEPDGWGSRFPALMNELHLGYLSSDLAEQAASELRTVRKELERLPASEVIADYDDPHQPPSHLPEDGGSLVEHFRAHDGRELLSVLEAGVARSRESGESIELESSKLPAEVGGPEPVGGLERGEVSRILATEARGALRAAAAEGAGPLEWRDDQAWWVGMVDLQESTSQPGAFLNGGVDWLWYERDWLAYSVGGRVGDFVAAEDAESFALAARRLAARGVDLLEDYRERFADIASCAVDLEERAEDSEWAPFDAGVACGLAGRMEDARRWLERFGERAESGSPVAPEAERARRLALLGDAESFRAEVCATIAAQRERLGLPRAGIDFC